MTHGTPVVAATGAGMTRSASLGCQQDVNSTWNEHRARRWTFTDMDGN